MRAQESAAARPTPADPGARLRALAEIATEVGASGVAVDASSFARRVAEGRFYVACVGQFKRGKSTLLNALIGAPVLPAGVVPVTAVVTVIRYGPRLAVRMQFVGGEWVDVDPEALAAYVTEQQNPQNEKGVEAVEVFAPSDLLASGMCLVDTPGIGSVFLANTAATQAFVPHIDAALVVLGADPPISGDELALVAQVAGQVHDLVFVLNKADRLSDSERNEAQAFTQQILHERLGRPAPPILEVSAIERLAGTGLLRDWQVLHETLDGLARRSGTVLVRAAEERGLTLLINRLLHELGEQRQALVRPVEESERRIATLKQCALEAERAMRDLGVLLAAEQERLRRQFLEQQEQFLARAIPEARRELAERLRPVAARRSPALRHDAILLAQETFKDWLERWRTEEQPWAEHMYAEAAERFVEIANGFLDCLASSGEPALVGLPRVIGSEVGFRTKSRLYYTEMLILTGRSPLRWLLDLLRAHPRVLRAVERDAGAYLERLLRTNAARLMNDLNDRVLESRRRLESEIRTVLANVYGSAQRALDSARASRASGDESVRAHLERLDVLRRQVEMLRTAPSSDVAERAESARVPGAS
jgi:predicted GTPase